MANTKLSALLKQIEESSGVISLPNLARDLEVSRARLEGMVEYWIRNGKIRVSATLSDCGSCGILDNCPFALEMPRTYELVINEGDWGLKTNEPGCKSGL
jgi:hypothetical protein